MYSLHVFFMEKGIFMDAFKQLLETITHLLGPQGCPWDQVQTMSSIRSNIIEEGSELVEAIDLNDNAHIQEELGDLFFVILFLCKLAEKEGRSTLNDVLHDANQKLVRRHPHVFGDAIIDSIAAHEKQWNEIKQQEKGKDLRTSSLDGIPKDLPSLARTQKVHKRMVEANFPEVPIGPKDVPSLSFETEEELGRVLYAIAASAQEKGLNAEHALRKTLAPLEKAFRAFETGRER
jgi:uncharacterized protein YabN with tetrapyrrole methylase and pyrophosphatase domain